MMDPATAVPHRTVLAHDGALLNKCVKNQLCFTNAPEKTALFFTVCKFFLQFLYTYTHRLLAKVV